MDLVKSSNKQTMHEAIEAQIATKLGKCESEREKTLSKRGNAT